MPFSLSQAHVEDGGDPGVGRRRSGSADLIAIEAGLVVRDRFPDRFFDVHLGLFAARHDEGLDLRDEASSATCSTGTASTPTRCFAAIGEGWPRQESSARSHEAAVADHQVFGVPTFISGEASAFVRIMTRPEGDGKLAVSTIEGVLELLDGHPELNEFKHTSISR